MKGYVLNNDTGTTNIRYIMYRVLESTTNCSVAAVGGDLECPVTGTIVSVGGFVDTAGITDPVTFIPRTIII